MTTLLPIALALLLQSTVLLALSLLAIHWTRRYGPALQSWIGRAALMSAALLLVLSTPLSHVVPALWHVSEPTPAQPTPAQAPAPPEAGRVGGGDMGGLNSRTRTARGKATARIQNADSIHRSTMEMGAASSTPPLRDAAALSSLAGRTPVTEERGNKEVGFLWPLGTFALLLWVALCQYYLLRLRRTASALTSGPAFEVLAGLTARPPQLLTHPAVRSPFLAGLRRPAIFLPTDYETEFGPTALRAILAHEVAHRDRSDNAWTLIIRLLCAALWFQPLLWLFCRRLEQISEESCDQVVLAHHCPPRAYADCLLTLAERHPLSRRERALGAGVAPFRSSLGQRITRILDKGTPTMSPVSTPLRLVVAAGAVAAVLGGALLVSCAPKQISAHGSSSSVAGDSSLSQSNARFLAGLTPVQGPGVVVTLRDSKMPYPGGLPTGMQPPNLIHDTDINQVVNELKASGAEAIAVNDQRLILTSAVRDIGHTIFVNNVPQAPPYIIRAIGNSRIMMTGINIHGGIATQIKSFDSHMFSAQETDRLNLPAYSGESGPRYARPVTPASFDTDRSQTLIQKRNQLEAQLNVLNEQAASLNAQLKHLSWEANQAVKKLPLPSPKIDEQTRLRREAVSRELTNALADLQQKKSTLASNSPAIRKAQAKVQTLKHEYQQIPIAEKEQFIQEIHQSNRQVVAIFNTYANKGKDTAHQLNNVKKQQYYLRSQISHLRNGATEIQYYIVGPTGVSPNSPAF